jgi:hypothetical protein
MPLQIRRIPVAKLKYGLQKKMQKETNRIASFDLAYDADDDNIIIAVAFRKDVKHNELIERMREVVSRSLDTIQEELKGGLKDAKTTDEAIDTLLAFVASQKKK